MNIDFTIARKKGGAIIWTEAQKHYIIEQYLNEKISTNVIAEQFHTSGEAIRRLLRKEKIIIINHKPRLPRNSNFFEKIDTPEKAYWLGIMYSDGYVIEGKKTCVGLGMIDKEHIEKFQKALKMLQHKITEYQPKNSSRPCFEITCNDKKMVEDLKKLNVLPRKSQVQIPFPSFLENEDLIRHFIRGYYDGDGSFCFSMKNNDFKVSFVGNKTFLEGLKKYLKKDKISLMRDKRSKIMYTFSMRGRNQVYDFLFWLYKDTTEDIRLNRKYEKYLEFASLTARTPLNP